MEEIWEKLENVLLDEFQECGHEYVHGSLLFKGHDTYGLPFDFMLDHVKYKMKKKPDMGGLRSELKVNYGWDDKRIDAELRGY